MCGELVDVMGDACVNRVFGIVLLLGKCAAYLNDIMLTMVGEIAW